MTSHIFILKTRVYSEVKMYSLNIKSVIPSCASRGCPSTTLRLIGRARPCLYLIWMQFTWNKKHDADNCFAPNNDPTFLPSQTKAKTWQLAFLVGILILVSTASLFSLVYDRNKKQTEKSETLIINENFVKSETLVINTKASLNFTSSCQHSNFFGWPWPEWLKIYIHLVLTDAKLMKSIAVNYRIWPAPNNWNWLLINKTRLKGVRGHDDVNCCFLSIKEKVRMTLARDHAASKVKCWRRVVMKDDGVSHNPQTNAHKVQPHSRGSFWHHLLGHTP